jgi:flagellar protein FliS
MARSRAVDKRLAHADVHEAEPTLDVAPASPKRQREASAATAARSTRPGRWGGHRTHAAVPEAALRRLASAPLHTTFSISSQTRLDRYSGYLQLTDRTIPMYASSSPFRSAATAPAAGMYTQVGVETGVNAADPHKLVSMLFDGALDAIAQARGALEAGRMEIKAAAINRAVRIVDEGLKGGLRLDSSKLADDLGALYGYVIVRLTHANLRNDDAALLECSLLIQPLRDAWSEIRGQVVAGAAA